MTTPRSGDGLETFLTTCADTFWSYYDRVILTLPRFSLFVFAAIVALFCTKVGDFRLDASGDTLVLEHDEDVRYYRAMTDLYESGDFVVMTYQPPEDLFSEVSLNRLRRIRGDLKAIERVASVVTLLDVPLLQNPPGTLADLKDNIKTLDSPDASLEYAIAEFGDSPIYQNLIVSKDLRSTAIQINFHSERSDLNLVARRSHLREKRYLDKISRVEEQELSALEVMYRVYKNDMQNQRHDDIANIRAIVRKYDKEAKIFLGGGPMVVSDIVAFIRSDLIVFGIGMLLFVIFTLYLVYRTKRWVFLPVLCCLASVIVMIGGMGWAHWDCTVVSSNFVSLQLILTMSLSIHVVSHYRELVRKKPEVRNKVLVLEATRNTFVPCFYTTLTTIVGFNSLVFSDIVPVVQFGWIMTMGLVVSLIIVFWLLPAGMVLQKKPSRKKVSEFGKPVTRFFARVTALRSGLIFGISALVMTATLVGILKLEVENSFVDYFRKSTEIYKGMKFIDQELGGTTPLDIIINLEERKEEAAPAEDEVADDEFDMFSEFEEEAEDRSRYWYTAARLATIERVHDYMDGLTETGKVLSLATLHKTVMKLNNDEALDDFSLAILFNAVSDEFQSVLVAPYVTVERNEARITTRIKDSLPGLRRDKLIKRIRRELVEKVGLREDQFRISGLMLLYNNMLQSLFASQFKTIGFTAIALLAMFVVLFRSLKLALIAFLPPFVASLSILGVMGLGGIPLDIMTITIVSIAVGIGVDNTIHYVYRFQHEIKRDRNYSKAIYRCHGTIGNAMFYTSFAITAGFSILSFSNFIPTILFGLLTGFAMVMSFIASQTLLPALILVIKPFGPGKSGLIIRKRTLPHKHA